MDIDVAWDFADPAASEVRFRALIAESWTQVARTLGLQRKFDEGHAVLDAVDSPNDRVRIRYLLERGRLFNSSNDPVRARPLFVEAYNLALAVGEDALEIDAAHMIAIVAEGDEAREWNELALARAAASEDPKARKWQASLLNNLGWTYHDAGDFERALSLFTEAQVVRSEMGQPRQEQIARYCIARCLRSMGRHEEALAILRPLHDEGVPDGFVAEELGENLLATGHEDDARGYFREAFERLSEDAWFAEHHPDRLERARALGAVSS